MTGDEARNLTELEEAALAAAINLADGHARHSLQQTTRRQLSEVATRLLHEGAPPVAEAERAFLSALGQHSGQAYDRGPWAILYSASVAFDAAAKLLALTGRRTGLVTPTFDNLHGLLRIASVSSVPVAEDRLLPSCDFDFLDGLGLQALIIVLPNNPTGHLWPADELIAVLQWAAARGVLMVFDLSFRLLQPSMCWDVISAAEDAGASALCIDDTGKALPLFDSKVGVMTATSDLARPVRRICTEILLNVSSLDLVLLTEALSWCDGLEVAAARDLATANRRRLRADLASFADTLFAGRDSSPAMSVEWLRLGVARDGVLHRCRTAGLDLLPGDRFHWDAGEDNPGREFARLALLRDESYFQSGVDVLREALGC